MLRILLFHVERDAPLYWIGDPYYNAIFRDFDKSWTGVSTTKFSTILIPEVAKAIKDYVKKKLKGCFVSIIVDEMKNKSGSYINFVLATRKDEDTPVLFFWDCKRSSGGKATDIASYISQEIYSLEECGIHCISYVSDNCNAMRATEKVLNQFTQEHIHRIPCASHVLNNILKDFIKRVEVINTVWTQVCISARMIMIRFTKQTHRYSQMQPFWICFTKHRNIFLMKNSSLSLKYRN